MVPPLSNPLVTTPVIIYRLCPGEICQGLMGLSVQCSWTQWTLPHSDPAKLLPGLQFQISSVANTFLINMASLVEPHWCWTCHALSCPRNFVHAVFFAWNAFPSFLLLHWNVLPDIHRLLASPCVRV